MQVSVESVEGLQRRMTVEVPVEKVDQAVESRLKSLARTVRLDGFRPGKVPLKVLRQRYGQQARQEAYGELIQSTFQEAAVQENLQPAGEPRIELKEEGDSFGYTAEFEVMPEVVLSELAGASVERDVAEVSDADVDTMLEKLRKQRTTWNAVEREAREEDRVTVSFVGKIDGEAFEGGTAEDVPLVIGSGMMIDGFEQAIVGKQPGEDLSIDLKFPDDYRVEHLAGKPVTFDITVKEVHEPVLPPMDEDFARALGVAEGTLEALREEVRGNMRRELAQRLRAIVKQRVMDLLMEHHDFAVPAVMIDAEARRMKEQARQERERNGQRSAMELPLDLFREDAERRVKLGLILAEAVKTHGLQVDEGRLRELASEHASAYESPEEVVNFYLSDRGARASLENLALEDAVVDWVLGKVDVQAKETTFDAVM